VTVWRGGVREADWSGKKLDSASGLPRGWSAMSSRLQLMLQKLKTQNATLNTLVACGFRKGMPD
jgi:hypothetical protein